MDLQFTPEIISFNIIFKSRISQYPYTVFVNEANILKSKRRIEQKAQAQALQQQEALANEEVCEQDDVNEKYKIDKNAIVGRKFPFTASQFKYPQDGKEQPKTFFRKYNDEYGSKKPNDLELPEKYFPINNTFTKEFNQLNFKNHSLNTAASRSKVHANLDSIV